MKQYFKEHRALRTETVIGDTRDFGIGRRINAVNWRALRQVGEHANQRLCDAQAADARPAPDVVTLTEVTLPSTTDDGQHASALRFADPRVMAAMSAIVGFSHGTVSSRAPQGDAIVAHSAATGRPANRILIELNRFWDNSRANNVARRGGERSDPAQPDLQCQRGVLRHGRRDRRPGTQRRGLSQHAGQSQAVG